MNPSTNTTPSDAPAEAERRYVFAADVCKACGLTLTEVENRLRPDDWASPRDFRLVRRGIQYVVASLPRLAEGFEAQGQLEAARLLRAYIEKLPAAWACGPEEVGQLVSVGRVDAGPDELDEAVAKAGRRQASDREQLPPNWSREWEESHE